MDQNEIIKLSLFENPKNISPRPSSDTETHQKIYQAFPEIGSIAHFHSTYATAWAQSGKPIPCLGTTHADYWYGEIPITRELNKNEINNNYERCTGELIVKKIKSMQINPLYCPGILVNKHGPFVWGENLKEAVKNSEILENIAKLSYKTISINPNSTTISNDLLVKHHSRKNGPTSYYGQSKIDKKSS